MDFKLTRQDGEFVITEGQIGYKLDVEASGVKISDYLTGEWDGSDASIELVYDTDVPRGGDGSLNEVKDVLGTFTTSYASSGSARSANVANGCRLINGKKNVFEKALLALVLLSYIQAFSDGNKRTARITSNAILIANKYCPISFRTVDSVDYKKAMLIFYEQNNISAFKKIFIDQFDFAVQTYF